MSRLSPVLLFCLFAFLVIGCEQSALDTPDDAAVEARSGDPIPGHYIVVMKSDALVAGKAPAQQAEGLAAEYGVAPQYVYGGGFTGFAGAISGTELARLADDDRVAYTEPDRRIVLDPITILGGKGKKPGGGTPPPDQSIPWGIARVNGVSSAANGVAFIVDTGIDLDHPDLNVHVSMGFTAFTRGKDANFNDGNGHGTHVAGTVAAINNSIGVIGVAPGTTVIPVKVLDSRGSGSYSGVIAGVNYVAANGGAGDVANLSLGGPVSQALDDVIVAAAKDSGVKFFLAAGNEGDDANNHSPARANGDNVFTISAFAQGDNFASFSNYGTPVDFAAPGVSILSTWKDGGYNTINGTSMATPHAAGVGLFGQPFSTDGYVSGDPDGDPDPIIVLN